MNGAYMIDNLTSSYGGLNIADSLDNMQPQYAIQMDNIIPDIDGDRVRNGYININSTATSILIPVLRGTTKKIIAAIIQFKYRRRHRVLPGSGRRFKCRKCISFHFEEIK